MAKQRVPITEKALYQRINRKLRVDGEALKHSRADSRAWLDLGDYFTVDVRENFVTRHHVDLADLGRELGVLAEWETLQ
jgi:hypothetical protein